MADQQDIKVQGITPAQFKFFSDYSTHSLKQFYVIEDPDGTGNQFHLDNLINQNKPAIVRNCIDYILPKTNKNGTQLFPFTVAGMDRYVQVNIILIVFYFLFFINLVNSLKCQNLFKSCWEKVLLSTWIHLDGLI